MRAGVGWRGGQRRYEGPHKCGGAIPAVRTAHPADCQKQRLQPQRHAEVPAVVQPARGAGRAATTTGARVATNRHMRGGTSSCARTWRKSQQGLLEGQLVGGGEAGLVADAQQRDAEEQGCAWAASRAAGSLNRGCHNPAQAAEWSAGSISPWSSTRPHSPTGGALGIRSRRLGATTQSHVRLWAGLGAGHGWGHTRCRRPAAARAEWKAAASPSRGFKLACRLCCDL